MADGGDRVSLVVSTERQPIGDAAMIAVWSN
jgi:hypothetical protein